MPKRFASWMPPCSLRTNALDGGREGQVRQIQKNDAGIRRYERSEAIATLISTAEVTRTDAADASSPVLSRSTQIRGRSSSRAGRMSWCQLRATWIQLSLCAPVDRAKKRKC